MVADFDNEYLGELLDAERRIQTRLGDGHRFDFPALQAISNIYRAANSVRNFMERDLLGRYGLSWGGFTTLFVLWIWGPLESHRLAEECGLAKGTLTGVVKTLEGRGLVVRRRLPSDRRRVEVSLSSNGLETIEEVFPRFNEREVRLTATITEMERELLADLLRTIISQTRA